MVPCVVVPCVVVPCVVVPCVVVPCVVVPCVVVGFVRGGGRACGLPVMLPGGAVEARGSRVPRERHRVSDAEGALDLGGTAPQAARHHRAHPTRTTPECLRHRRRDGARCSTAATGIS